MDGRSSSHDNKSLCSVSLHDCKYSRMKIQNSNYGDAVTQVVSRRLTNAVAWVLSQVR
jgi:hypothetical protein